MASAAVEDSDFEEGASISNIGADDSDAESLVDIEAPADGYFERRQIPQQRYAENPAHPATKTEEAASEQLQSRQPAVERVRTQQTRPEGSSVSFVPLMDAGPAPPDYQAATAGQREQQQQVFSLDHPLVRNGLLAEHGVFGQRDQPQSMQDVTAEQLAPAAGGARDREEADLAQVEEQAHEETPLVQKPSRRAQTRRRGSRCLKVCTLLVGVLILVIVAIVLTRVVGKHNSGNSPEQGSPAEGDHGDGDGERRPTHPEPSRHCDFRYDNPSQVFNLNASDDGQFGFSEMWFAEENPYLLPGGRTRLSGTIHIFPSKEDRDEDEPDIRVEVHIATTGNIQINRLNFVRERARLRMLFPAIQNDGPDRLRECFDIAVGIQVKRGVQLRFWDIVTGNMDVVVDEGIFGREEQGSNTRREGVQIDHTSSIHALRGNIDVAYWQSGRSTYVKTDSGDIKGYFALLDDLELISKSGNILAYVDPKNPSDERPSSARFKMVSHSGTVHAEFPTHGDFHKRSIIPDRGYQVIVETQSGPISGTYVLGDSAQFQSNSGDMDVAVMPYSTNLKYSSLSSSTSSGDQKFELLSPYEPESFTPSWEHREGMVDELNSYHKSTSGDLKVKYPQEWSGEIDAVSVSGSIHIEGRDVEVCADKVTPLANRCIRRKGSGDSYLQLDSVSGSVDVLVGET